MKSDLDRQYVIESLVFAASGESGDVTQWAEQAAANLKLHAIRCVHTALPPDAAATTPPCDQRPRLRGSASPLPRRCARGHPTRSTCYWRAGTRRPARASRRCTGSTTSGRWRKCRTRRPVRLDPRRGSRRRLRGVSGAVDDGPLSRPGGRPRAWPRVAATLHWRSAEAPDRQPVRRVPQFSADCAAASSKCA